MEIAFLFPESGPYEALDNWVKTLGRHAGEHVVSLARTPQECAGRDCVFVLTESNSYPLAKVDADVAALTELKATFGVVHNNDAPAKKQSGIPTPGRYPSFVWTRRGQERLLAHKPTLLRQPLFSPIVGESVNQPLLVGTFGHIEPKKQTFEMGRWAKKNGVPFKAVGPDALKDVYDSYIADLRSYGCDFQFHPWLEKVEELAPHVADFTHFLFVLPDSKRGTGGSPTSPRFAGFFNRPIIVVDDEYGFLEDGCYVYRLLDELRRDDLATMKPPSCEWGPVAYLDALTKGTLAFWRR